jgi:hypothetical protein
MTRPAQCRGQAARQPARATQRRSVTAAGHTQVAQYPLGLAAPAESVRPLVESVAPRSSVRAWPPTVRAATTTTGLRALAAVAAAVSLASPAPITTTASLLCSRMQI